ncbi:MAG: T9SS type A sorting domain-containing protein [Chitinophagaceae bacterium]|nr:T9SS type A sorting domain-containing protein [Chitinophagaceae bacterium]
MKTKLNAALRIRHFVCVVIFFISLLSSPFSSVGQSETHDFVTYDTIVNVPGQTWRMRISRPVNMFTPNHPDTASRPALITMPGVGEVGTNYANLRKYGPHYWLDNGWDGSITTGNGKHYPILVTVIAQTANPRVNSAIEILQHILKTYRIKRNSVHLGGISMGAFTWAGLLNGQSSAGDETGMKLVTSLVLLQGGGQGATSGIMGSAVPFDATGYNAFGRWASKYGGKFFGIEGTADTRNIWMIRDNMEANRPGSAYFSFANIGGGGHCCWNDMYDPKRKNWKNQQNDLGTNIAWNTNYKNSMGTYKNGWSVFEWMFRQGDTTLVGQGKPIEVSSPPQVNAGPNQTITLPTSSVNLSGKATPASGASINTVSWSQISGPSTASIGTAGSLNTTISPLQKGSYVFRLTATDNKGMSGSATVTITVNEAANNAPVANAGPDQTITLPTNTAMLNGSGTDSDGTISAYNWTKVSGPAAVIATPNTAKTNVTGLLAGTYVFQLTVTDNKGAAGTATTTIKVNAAVVQAPPAPAPLPPVSGAQIQVGPGEYQTFFIDKSGTLWGVGSIRNMGVGGGGVTGVPQKVSVSPTNTKFKSAAGGLHGGGGVDVNGNVWIVGDAGHGQYGNGSYVQNTIANKILTDTTGAPFTNVDTLCAFFYKDGSNGYNGFYAVKSDGTLWVWGRPWKGLSGNGVDLTNKADVTRPMKITIPGNRKVKQIAVGQTPVVLCTDGTVWTWGINNVANLGYPATATQMLSPNQIPSLTDIVYVSGTWAFWYALKKDGTLYGWGSQGNMMGDPTYPTGSGVAYATPTVLSNITKHLPAPIAKIQTNFNSTMVLLTNGLLYGWGDNAECNIGNGFLYEHPNPYAWDFQVGRALVKVPYNVGSGKKWKDVWGPTNYGFYWYALDAEDNLYCWGRNKASVLAVQIRGGSATIAASYQDSWNRKWPTLVNPFNQTTSYPSTSPYCIANPSGSPCDSYAIPANTKPKANAGSNQDIPGTSTILDASASTDNVFIAYYEWKQVSGPNTAAMETPGNPKTIIKNLVKGSYVFRVVVTDNGWLSDSATVTINVGGAVANQPPTANAGTNQTITLPTNSVTLTGSGTDTDGTISSYTWTKVSGPAATIATPSAAKTNVTGLVAGTYVFRLTVTDNSGATGTANVTITVNAAPNQAPAANAGPNQTITLPTNSVTLTGSGTDTDGTISSYTWTKVSGPAATIATPSAAKTNVTGLVAGTYVFRLTVTDNSGATGTATVTITVSEMVESDKAIQNTPDLDVKINPNPVKTDMTVLIDSKAMGRTTIQVYDIKGMLLLQTEFVKDIPGKVTRLVDMSKYPAGIYVVQVIVDYSYRKSVTMIKQ